MHEPLTLPSEMTIYNVAELRTQCLAWLAHMQAAPHDGAAAHLPWQVDAAAVSEVDGAGLQLLQSLAHSVAHGHPDRNLRPSLRVENPSPALVSACSALGLEALLADIAAPGVAA
jgi:hypothetical protein